MAVAASAGRVVFSEQLLATRPYRQDAAIQGFVHLQDSGFQRRRLLRADNLCQCLGLGVDKARVRPRKTEPLFRTFVFADNRASVLDMGFRV